MLFFAGHRSQQPSRNLNGEERDGLDETFLPPDVGSWNDATKEVVRAIVDDTFDSWLARLEKKGAHVWFIADSCHSGTLNRGGEEEPVRRIEPADLGVPPRPEHVLMIAVKARIPRQSTSIKWLAQPSPETARQMIFTRRFNRH